MHAVLNFKVEQFAKRLEIRRTRMKLEWRKPEVTEQQVGLEVTSYAPAELDQP